MIRILRNALLPLLVAGVSLSTTACKTTCDENGVCTAVSTVAYTGTAVQQEVNWSPGQAINIDVEGGNVRVGKTATTAITVNKGTGDKVIVKFTPINNDTEENRDAATKQMSSPENGGNLALTATNDGNAVGILVDVQGKASSGLSARVDVTLPAGFDGALSAHTEYGDISVADVNRGVDIANTKGIGDIYVELNGTAPLGANGEQSTVSGKISAHSGDIKLVVPSTGNITIGATADGASGEVIYPETLPTNWTATVGDINAVTLQGNAGSPMWHVDTDSGKVYLEIK